MNTIELLAKLKCHFRGKKSLIFLFEHNLFLYSLDHCTKRMQAGMRSSAGMWGYQPINKSLVLVWDQMQILW